MKVDGDNKLHHPLFQNSGENDGHYWLLIHVGSHNQKKNKRNLASSIQIPLVANRCHVIPSIAVIAYTIAH